MQQPALALLPAKNSSHGPCRSRVLITSAANMLDRDSNFLFLIVNRVFNAFGTFFQEIYF